MTVRNSFFERKTIDFSTPKIFAVYYLPQRCGSSSDYPPARGSNMSYAFDNKRILHSEKT